MNEYIGGVDKKYIFSKNWYTIILEKLKFR